MGRTRNPNQIKYRYKPMTTVQVRKNNRKTVKNQIDRALSHDRNIIYQNANDAALSTLGTGGGTVYALNTCATGDGEAGRTGNTIKCIYMDLSYRLSGDDVSLDGQTSPQPKVRIVIFKQKISITGALLTTPTLMFSNLAEATGCDMLHEPLPQWNARSTFKIYYDKVVTLRTAGVNESTTTAGVMVPDSWIIYETNCIRIKRKLNFRTTFSSTTAASANQNVLYICFLPQTTTGRVSFFSRVQYLE